MFRKSNSVGVIVRRAISQGVDSSKPAASSSTISPAPTGINANVPGLSTKCVKNVTGPVGPGAASNATYKVPEYFLFNRYSYVEAELEMAKYRCPQPSALKK